jgi:hypothetical protein
MTPSPELEDPMPEFLFRFWTRFRSSSLGRRFASGAF